MFMAAQKWIEANLWQEFFLDPSQWWDTRSEKINPSYPDFKHKKTGDALWISDNSTPPWVQSGLASIVPGTLQVTIFTWNKRLTRYVKAGQYKKTMQLFQQMQQEGMTPDKFTFIPVLNACSGLRDLEEGRHVHLEILRTGHESDVYVGTCLVDMYGKCGSMMDALTVFNMMPSKGVVAWTALIMGYVKCGEGQKALELFQQMHYEGVEPNPVTFVGVLNACASLAALEEGRYFHKQIMQRGYESNVFVGSSLIDMYAKCGSIEDAWKVFKKIPTRNVVGWNAMIQGYVKCGEGEKALELFQQMPCEGVEANNVTFVSVLNACASQVALEEGRSVHEQIRQRGHESDTFVSSSLIDMYAKCGSTEDALRVFNNMSTRDVVGWNSMIQGYVKCGEGKKALELYHQMNCEGVEPNPVTFIGVLNACASVGGLEQGRNVHKQIVDRGYESDNFVHNSLIDMYAKCGMMEDAFRVFNKISTRNVVPWNALIAGYVKCGEGQKALELFQQMPCEGVEPTPVTFVAVLNACASVGALEEGRRVYEQILHIGYESHSFVASCLIDMYAKCGSIEDALGVFKKIPTREVVAWTALIVGYVRCGEGNKALELFQLMNVKGVEANPVTFVAVLNACANMAALEQGKHVHEQIRRSSYEPDIFVGNSLIDMYSKCGSIEDSLKVFNNMPTRDVVAWNSMIQGYVKCGEGNKGLELFRQMHVEGVKPNPVTFVGVLKACAIVTALEEGRSFHEQIIESGYECDSFVHNSLIDMYAKCGSIEDAVRVFNKIPTRDVVAWNAMIGGYAVHGLTEEALQHFDCMCQQGLEVDEFTFSSLLSACSHGGLLNEGLHYFESMSTVYNIFPTVNHVTCIVDLLGRAGRLDEAEDVIKSSCEPSAPVWMSLLGACRVHGNVEMALCVSKQVLDLEPESAAGYVLLSNVYAAAGMWESCAKVQKERLEKSVKEDPVRRKRG